MMKKLIIGVFVTAVAALPLAARADWNDLKTRRRQSRAARQAAREQGPEPRGARQEAQTEGTTDYDKGKVVEQKTVTTYKKGRNYAKTTTKKIHKE